MGKPTVFFCSNKIAKELAKSTGMELIHYPATSKAGIESLRQGKSVVCSEVGISLGWAAPRPCNYVFIEGFPEDSASRRQAVGRIDRIEFSKIDKPNFGDKLLSEFAFGRRIEEFFRNYHLVTLRDLSSFSKKSLLEIPNLGKRSVDKIENITGIIFLPRNIRDDRHTFRKSIVEFFNLSVGDDARILETCKLFFITKEELDFCIRNSQR